MLKEQLHSQNNDKGGIFMLVIENLSKIYPNGSTALNNVSIKIETGEFVFLVGPSGAGKSTLMKALFREIAPTEGKIYVDSKDILSLSNEQVPYLRRQLGIIFQDYRLLPERTIYDNVAFAMQVIEEPYFRIKRRVRSVLNLVGLKGREDAYPNELSGGEQQRVAIARAIVNGPEIVIADEPTGNLDPDTSNEIMDIFERINCAGTTIIMATHDKDIVDSRGKRVVALENGSIVRDDREGIYGYER